MPHQGQAEAATAGTVGRLGREAPLEDALAQPVGDPGAGVGDDELEVVAVGARGQLDPALTGGAGDRVEGVVDEVADDGDDVARRRGAGGPGEVGVDDEVDAALVRLGRLAEEQRRQRRVLDAGDDPVGEHLRAHELLGREVDGPVGVAELDERDHRVQPVARLVRLRAQRLAEAAGLPELAGQLLEVGAVADRHDRPEVGAVAVGAGLVEDEDAAVGDVEVVLTGLLVGHRPHERVGEVEVGDEGAGRVLAKAEQPQGLVVGEADPALGVDEDQALGHRVEDGVVVVVHVLQLARREAAGLPADPSGDEGRAQPADEPGHDARDPERDELGRHQLVDVALAHPHRDEAHDLGAVEDGDDRATARPEGADVVLEDGPAGERLLGVAEELLADLRGVGVAVPDALRAHDDDEVGPGPQPDALGEGLQRPAGVPGADAVDDLGLGGHRLRHREDLGRRLLGHRLAGLRVGRRESGHDDGRDERDDERRRLGRDAAPQHALRPRSRQGGP